jgi:hypothetical protein
MKSILVHILVISNQLLIRIILYDKFSYTYLLPVGNNVKTVRPKAQRCYEKFTNDLWPLCHTNVLIHYVYTNIYQLQSLKAI